MKWYTTKEGQKALYDAFSLVGEDADVGFGQEKLVLHEEIARYAAEMAGTGDDLDEQMEAAGLEHLDNCEKQP